MNWIDDSRGRYPDYNEEDGGYSPPTWYEAVQFILAVPLLALFGMIIALIAALAGFYFIAKETCEKGESPFPILTNIGFIMAGILVIIRFGFGLDFSLNSFCPGILIPFIFYFSLAPLTGLILHFIHLLTTEKQGENHD